MSHPRCANCGAASLLHCSQCRVRQYCSHACGQDYWQRVHHQECLTLAETRVCRAAPGPDALQTADGVRAFLFDAGAYVIGGGGTGVVWANDAIAPGWAVKVSKGPLRTLHREFETMCAIQSSVAARASTLVRLVAGPLATDALAVTDHSAAMVMQRIYPPPPGPSTVAVQAYAGDVPTDKPGVLHATRGLYVTLDAIEPMLGESGALRRDAAVWRRLGRDRPRVSRRTHARRPRGAALRPGL